MKIALCAGEESGDLLGADLIEALRHRVPGLRFVGIGGDRMQAAGMDCWHASRELAVMGLSEVVRHLPRLLKLRRQFVRRLLEEAPDIYIGIDAPDFNLGVERQLKRARLRTVHYVSPSVWAWRSERIQRIALSADLVLCLFPFEPALYDRAGVPAVFVGHPLAEAFPSEKSPQGSRAMLGLPANTPILALLPGSRRSEIERLAPIFLDTAGWLKQRMPKLITLAPMANDLCRRLVEPMLEPSHGVRLVDGDAHAVLKAADCALVASGTATLESALARTPMVVAYRVSRLTEWMLRAMGGLNTPWFSLVNQLAGRALVPEFKQAEVSVQVLGASVLELFAPDAQARYQQAFTDIHGSLRAQRPSAAAEAILNLVFQ